MDDETSVAPGDECLPYEYRVLKWKDGYHSFHRVYFKGGEPFSYAEEGDCVIGAQSLEELNAILRELTIGVHQAGMNEILSEDADFPGQYRYEFEMDYWLRRQREHLIKDKLSPTEAD